MSTSTPPQSRPSTPSQSRTSSPARPSFRSRMGTAMRRASTGLTIVRPSSALARSDSKSSLKVASTAALAPSEQDSHTAPSPVAESPAREAAEAAETNAEAPASTGPSPLAQSTVAPPVEISLAQASPPVVSQPEVPVIAVPAPEVPRTVEIPQTAAVETTASVSASASPPPMPAALPEAVYTAEPESISELPSLRQPAQAAFQPAVVPAVPQQPDRLAQGPSPINVLPASQPVPTVPITEASQPISERPADFFAWKDDVAVAPKKSVSSLAPSTAAPDASVAAPQVDASRVVHAETDHADVYAWRDEAIPSKRSSISSTNRRDSIRPSSPPTRARSLSPRGSRTSLASSFGQVMISAPGKNVSVSVDPTDIEQRRGRSSSVRISIEDPFADPFADPPNSERMPMPMPRTALSPIYSTNMPSPHPAAPEEPQPEIAEPESDPFFQGFAPTTMPVPETMPDATVQTDFIGYAIGDGPSTSGQQVQHDTDERIPLLQQPAPPARGGNGKAIAYANAGTTSAVAFPSAGKPSGSHTFEALGWKQYTLPDSVVYFANANLRVTTDVDLRNHRKLAAVKDYLDRKLPEEVAMPPAGWELWLRDAGTTRHDFKLVRNWVSHGARMLSSDPPPTISGEVDSLTKQFSDDDRLDMEYRYWGFLESHPAHAPLAEGAKAEAMEALTWSHMDCLLPSSRPVQPPFAPQECQELMGLLRSYDSTTPNAPVVQTRIVARVLLRIVQWRQYYFRPNKPLPRDAIKGGAIPESRIPFQRTMLNFVIGVLGLGIPYLFMGRANHQRVDEESGLSSAGPMLVLGACACLIAAVVLSASVTFITLPGLDDVTRLAGLVAIMFSASSIVSAVIALLRYKTDIERSSVYIHGEGLMVLSRRSVVMSMPLVFLAWAIAAFMAGIALYSFRGAMITSKTAVRQPFSEYTQWTVVGTMGGVAGFLFIVFLLARR